MASPMMRLKRPPEIAQLGVMRPARRLVISGLPDRNWQDAYHARDGFFLTAGGHALSLLRASTVDENRVRFHRQLHPHPPRKSLSSTSAVITFTGSSSPTRRSPPSTPRPTGSSPAPTTRALRPMSPPCGGSPWTSDRKSKSGRHTPTTPP